MKFLGPMRHQQYYQKIEIELIGNIEHMLRTIAFIKMDVNNTIFVTPSTFNMSLKQSSMRN